MFFIRTEIRIQKFRINKLFVVFWLIYLALVNGQCPPTDKETKVITNFLNTKLTEIRKLKPGTNPKDAEWVIYRVVKDISTNNKFAPCNNGFPWNQVEEDANLIKNDCYKPSDLTQVSAQKEIINCSKKFYPQFLLRYGKQGLDSCACFSKHIIPNWKKRYQKYATDYIEEFKTLKHRKMNIEKIKGI